MTEAFTSTIHLPVISSRTRNEWWIQQRCSIYSGEPPSSSLTTTTAGATSEKATAVESSSNNEDGNVVIKMGVGLRDVIDEYDIFLLDMWGVLHDGTVPYEGVLDAIRQLRDAKKEIIILSNSSQRKQHSIRNLEQLGFNPLKDFSQIITSGEVSYQMLQSFTSWSVLEEFKKKKQGKKEPKSQIFLLGSGNGDEEYCTDCGWVLAPTLQEADLILARGTFTIQDGTRIIVDKNKDPDGYEEQLQLYLRKAAGLQLPMLISNPDKIRPDGDRSPMPGRIGDLYQQELRAVHGEDTIQNIEDFIKRIGKPFPEVYDLAIGHQQQRRRICMVGDALETDITGGSNTNIDTIWILNDGIHSPDILSQRTILEGATMVLNQFNENCENTYAKGRVQKPTIALPHFRW